MKKKQLIAALGMTLVLSLAISGCAAGTQSTTETAASETVTAAAENTELENTSVNETESTEAEPKKRSRSRRHKKSPVLQGEEAGSATPEPLSSADGESTPSPARKKSRHRKKPVKPAAAAEGGAAAHAEKIEGDRPAHQHHTHTKASEGAAHGEAHSVTVKPAGAKASHRPRHRSRRPKSPAAPSEE